MNPIAAEMNGFMTDAELNNREQQAIADCMARLGYEFTPSRLPESEPLTRAEARQYRSTNGFGAGLAEGTARAVQNATSSNMERFAAMSKQELDAYFAALEGDDRSEDKEPGGCAGEARTMMAELAPSLSGDADVHARFRDQYRALADDPAMMQALEHYRDCMLAATTREVVSPDHARELALNNDRAGQPDIELALADWDCQNTTTWVVWDSRARADASRD